MSDPIYRALLLQLQNAEAEKRAAQDAIAEKNSQLQAAIAEKEETERRAAAEIAARDQLLEDKDRMLYHEQLKREHAELKTRPSTLTEYLHLCHTHLSKYLSVETRPNMTSSGGITLPINKKRPDYLRPWVDFPSIQKKTLYRLFAAYPLDSHLHAFNSRIGMEEKGEDDMITLSCEKDLEALARPMLITPVSKIMKHLTSIPAICKEFHIDCDLHFMGHHNAIPNPQFTPTTPPTATVTQSPETEPAQPDLPTTPPNSSAGRRGKPDIICLFSSPDCLDEPRPPKLVLPIEIKPPHKLRSHDLKSGFCSMNLLSDIINVNKTPTDVRANQLYRSKQKVASVVTQTFSYMVEGGVEYGIVVTGEAFAFLHMSLENPTIVYYHLAIPNSDVQHKISLGEDHLHRTAVSQVLAFTLLALESSRQRQSTNQDQINTALNKLERWPRTSTTPASPEAHSTNASPDTSSPYQGRNTSRNNKDPPSTPVSSGTRSKRAVRYTCNPGKVEPDDEDREESPEPPEPGPPLFDSPFVISRQRQPPKADNNQNSKQSPSGSAAGKQSRHGSPPYCTLTCLLSLSSSGPLDPGCPNYSLHSAKDRLTPNSFLFLLRAQLSQTLDHHIYPLGIQGATGILFKVVLSGWGYVLMAKGTVPALKGNLLHESQIYARMESLQGKYIPVCLGAIDLLRPYYYSIGVRVTYLLLLSYGGQPLPQHISQVIWPGDEWWKSADVRRTVDAVRACGVDHGDVRLPNLLWDNSRQRVMLIDFERSVVMEGREVDMLEESPGTRKRKREWKPVD